MLLLLVVVSDDDDDDDELMLMLFCAMSQKQKFSRIINQINNSEKWREFILKWTLR